MYKVLFEPTYRDPEEIGRTVTVEEAMELIYLYCNEYCYTPTISHWYKLDAPNREIIDVGTGHDYFLIINEDGGRVNIE